MKDRTASDAMRIAQEFTEENRDVLEDMLLFYLESKGEIKDGSDPTTEETILFRRINSLLF